MHLRLPVPPAVLRRAIAAALRRSTAAALATLLAIGLAMVATPSSARTEDPGTGDPGTGDLGTEDPVTEEPETGELTMVQANIKTGKPTFAADVARVMALDPDFISYNEVMFRSDESLAPEGYSLYRNMRNRYTAASPVAWKNADWTMIDSGSFRISNVRTIPDRKVTRLGLRFANWATLRSVDGRVLSIVSVHVAPVFRIDRKEVDLIRPSVSRLGKLVEKLAPAGPVLVGGDFNVHYTSGRYPRDLFEAAGLVPTYDTLGSHFPTGDHRGATIDYLFARGAGQLGAVHQANMELGSDHDAVIGGFDWAVPAPGEFTEVVSDPAGTVLERRAVVREMNRRIRATIPGQRIVVVTGSLNHRVLFRALRDAVTRGIQVEVLSRAKRRTPLERRLRRHIRASGTTSSLAPCREECKVRWRNTRMRRTFVLVSNETGPVLRVDANRNLNERLPKQRAKLVVRNGETVLAEALQMLTEVRRTGS